MIKWGNAEIRPVHAFLPVRDGPYPRAAGSASHIGTRLRMVREMQKRQPD